MTKKLSLVEQLQADAMDSSLPVTDLLRKARVVAVKLKQDELTEWLENETRGYDDLKSLPEYRHLAAQLKFMNPVHGWCPVVGADSVFKYGAPLGEIMNLLSGRGELMTQVKPSVVERISEQVGFQVDVKRFISRAAVAAIIECVRDTILEWALKLEQAGIHGEGLSFSPNEEQKAQSVVVNIGSIANAAGIGAFGDHATINANQTANINELVAGVEELVKQAEGALRTSGLPVATRANATAALVELKAAAATNKPDASRLRKGLASLRTIMEGAAGNLVASGVLAMIAKLVGAS